MKLAQLENKTIPQIVIVGKKGWLTEDLAHVIEKDPSIDGKLLWLSNLTDAELKWLYINCAFTIFPSICEGWGLPIAESLQNGKFCLASSVSSMLEIGTGLIDYFSPYDARSCLDKILKYSADEYYKQANAKISKAYKPYSWDESYEVFSKVVLEV